MLFVTAPFLEDLRHGELIQVSLFTLVLLFGVLAIGGQRRVLAIATALFGPAIIGKWLAVFFPDSVPLHAHLLFGLAFIGFVVAHLLVAMYSPEARHAPRTDGH